VKSDDLDQPGEEPRSTRTRRHRRRTRSAGHTLSRGHALTRRVRGLATALVLVSRWLAAGLLLALPFYLAWDYGGVLAYSRWIAATVVIAVALISLPMLIAVTWGPRSPRASTGNASDEAAGINRRVLALPLIGLAVWGLAWLQTLPIGSAAVGFLSHGSASAYADWVPDAIRHEVVSATGSDAFDPSVQAIAAGWHPISICVELTRVAQAGPAIFAVVCLIAAITFRTRRAMIALFAGLAFSGALIAFLGISDKIRAPAPGIDHSLITPGETIGAPFGPFVCRNNAAGYLNLTLAAAVGLLVYCFRLTKDQSDGDSDYQLQAETRWDRVVFFFQNALLQIDAATVFSLVLVILNIAGILASQSRGGTLGLIAGGLVACLLTGNRSANWWKPVGVLISVGGVIMLLGSIGLIEPIRRRLETLWSDDTPEDGRLGHWADALTAAWHHLPAGSGLGTHRYAYLPYQQYSAGTWFVNADNTSIEWLVEGGVWLVVLVLLAVALVATSLIRIAQVRKAPHLTALVAAGWFMIASQLVCQFFDFGILLPSNYITLALLVGAIMGVAGRRFRPDGHRSHSPGLSLAPQNHAPTSTTAEPEARLALWLILALGIATLIDAQAMARRGAVEDSLKRDIARTDGRLNLQAAALSDQAFSSGDPSLHTAFASHKLAQQVAAGRQTLERLPPEQGLHPVRDSTLQTRRSVYYLALAAQGKPPSDALLPAQSAVEILAARRHAISALMLCPLDDVARFQLLQTGFLADDSVATAAELLDQWTRLRIRFAPALDLAVRLAVVHPAGETARLVIQRLLITEPGRLSSIWPILPLVIAGRGEATISELLPDDAELLVTAVEMHANGPHSLGSDLQNELLGRASRLIQSQRQVAPAGDQEAKLAFLAGRIEALQAGPAAAEPWFRQAVALDPSTTAYRFRWAETLEKLEQKAEAIEQIKVCLLQSPQNPQYQTKLRQLHSRARPR